MASASSHGLLVVDKPAGITSRAVVDRAQRWFLGRTRIGHAGTLDPLATGVLVLCVGAATRLIEYVQRMDKVYRAGLLLGARSDTDDADGVVTSISEAQAPDLTAVQAQLATFLGEQLQLPPAFSAAKVGGRRAYALARGGQAPPLQPRTIAIHDIRLSGFEYPHLEIDVRCGKGTYIRALARDLGERLGCGALVESLRRLRIGPFDVAQGLTLETDKAVAREHLLPLALAVGDLPRLALSDEEIQRLRQGQEVIIAQGQLATGEMAVFDRTGTLAALVVADGQRLRPEKVLAY